MNIWLVTIGEPVPVEEGVRDRLHRTGFFGRFLARHGHRVTWWTSTFDHFRKNHWVEEDRDLDSADGVRIRMVHGCGYRSNLSLARLRDHRQIAAKFAAMAPARIIATIPTFTQSIWMPALGFF